MPKYMLLLYESPEPPPADLSPEVLQAILQKYMTWNEKTAKAGKLVGGEKLREAQGRVLRGVGSKMKVTDGPYAETKEVIGGYYLIEAKNYDEAVQLAKDNPNLEFGSIEIREIDPITG